MVPLYVLPPCPPFGTYDPLLNRPLVDVVDTSRILGSFHGPP